MHTHGYSVWKKLPSRPPHQSSSRAPTYVPTASRKDDSSECRTRAERTVTKSCGPFAGTWRISLAHACRIISIQATREIAPAKTASHLGAHLPPRRCSQAAEVDRTGRSTRSRLENLLNPASNTVLPREITTRSLTTPSTGGCAGRGGISTAAYTLMGRFMFLHEQKQAS